MFTYFPWPHRLICRSYIPKQTRSFRKGERRGCEMGSENVRNAFLHSQVLWSIIIGSDWGETMSPWKDQPQFPPLKQSASVTTFFEALSNCLSSTRFVMPAAVPIAPCPVTLKSGAARSGSTPASCSSIAKATLLAKGKHWWMFMAGVHHW